MHRYNCAPRYLPPEFINISYSKQSFQCQISCSRFVRSQLDYLDMRVPSSEWSVVVRDASGSLHAAQIFPSVAEGFELWPGVGPPHLLTPKPCCHTIVEFVYYKLQRPLSHRYSIFTLLGGIESDGVVHATFNSCGE